MISPSHKTIFVHIPKCAGQSIETAFLTDCGLDWSTRAELLLRPNTDPERGPPRLAHLLARDYVALGYVDAPTFRDWYSFAVVRDPFSRAVSLYRHLDLNMSFRRFVLDWLDGQFQDGPESGNFWFVRPQVDFVTGDGDIVVKDILRFESLAQDFRRMADRAGLRSALRRVNTHENRTAPDQHRRTSVARRLRGAFRAVVTPDRRTRRDDWREYYEPDCVSAIRRLYAEDFERFGYAPEPAGRDACAG